MSKEVGPEFRWFAWHPTWTRDRGWRWLIMLNRRRFFQDDGIIGGTFSGFETCVKEWV